MIPIIPKRELMMLGAQHRRIGELLQLSDEKLFAVNEKVSHWSTALQLYHVTNVNEAVFGVIVKIHEGTDAQYSKKPSIKLIGRIVMTFGKVPRGRAKAPDRFVPPQDIDREKLTSQFEASKKALTKLAPILEELKAAKGSFPHPYFGNLNALQWLKFTRIHTAHHLKIVDDILK